ncbi:MAG: pantothenate kinase [Aphanocapsa sp. GSE-SYN-MK-11-07L]|jgi:type III pantothenate kinase|nr:pantothenate kinase [Aphanocapsa sp. GSE-SYN-MK-11-07L]
MNANPQAVNKRWLALSIGNSRYHWAMFESEQLQQTWETPHLVNQDWRSLLESAIAKTPLADLPELPELWLASVVPGQTQQWQAYPNLHPIQLADVPLRQTYATLGLDRALAIWGAGMTWGWPVLVIDCGTALSLTGASAKAELVGGAILPGLGLQGRSLAQSTAALPSISFWQSQPLPTRWAKETGAAIASGILYVLLAGLADFIEDWWQHYPHSQVIFTGGDSQVLTEYLRTWLDQNPVKVDWQEALKVDPYLIFRGISHLRQHHLC